MVYILEIYELRAFCSEYVFNTYKQALKAAKDYRACYTYNELSINIYEAVNEYTNKRKLIKSV